MGSEEKHPWAEIAKWAGWRKGKKAKRSDHEVADMWGVPTISWVGHRRRLLGALPAWKHKRSWAEDDYAYVVQACADVGRTPGAFAAETKRRKKRRER